jgi:hypothetical protein
MPSQYAQAATVTPPGADRGGVTGWARPGFVPAGAVLDQKWPAACATSSWWIGLGVNSAP